MADADRATELIQAPIAPFLLTLPIAKVDKELRLVTGIVTAEILDKQGEIVDYATAKKFFTDPELWPGNMREMHQTKAVGKRIEVACDDDNKTISLTSRVSKGAPDTWEKVLDGTLSMYSIGGNGKRVLEKHGEGTAKRLFLEQLAEVSYVDNGACPAAKFEIVKSVDGVLTDVQPAEPEADPVAKALETAAAAVATAATPAPAIDYAGPGQTFPIVKVDDVRACARGLARLAGSAERHAVKTALVTIATAKGADFVAALQPVAKGGMESYDIDQALTAISVLERLASQEYYDAKYSTPAGTTPDPVKTAQVAMLKSAIDAVLQFLLSEHEEQFTVDAQGGGLAMDLEATVEMFVKSLDVIQKAGARHSKGDMEMVQKVHDLAGNLGANCHTDDAEKIAKAVVAGLGTIEGTLTELKVSEPSEAVQKLTTELETTKAELATLKATAADQAKADAEVKKRLEALEAQPLPGGPARQVVVDKTLGGPIDQPVGPGEHDPVLKAFDTLAAAAADEPARMELVTQKLSYMRAHALGALDPISGQPIA